MDEPLTKEVIDNIKKMIGWVDCYHDIHKEKTEKYVDKLCRYLAVVKGYRYWSDLKKRNIKF